MEASLYFCLPVILLFSPVLSGPQLCWLWQLWGQSALSPAPSVQGPYIQPDMLNLLFLLQAWPQCWQLVLNFSCYPSKTILLHPVPSTKCYVFLLLIEMNDTLSSSIVSLFFLHTLLQQLKLDLMFSLYIHKMYPNVTKIIVDNTVKGR